MPIQLNRSLVRVPRREVPTYTLSITPADTGLAVAPRAIGTVWRSGSLPSCYRWWFTPNEESIAWYRERTGDNLPSIRSCRTRAEVTALIIELLEESL